MIAHVIDAVLLAALVLTSLRVGAIYREMKRLRGYQAQYIEVFDETSRALADIDTAVRHLNGDGRELLERLGRSIDEAHGLAERLEALAVKPAAPPDRAERSDPDDIGAYSPGELIKAAALDVSGRTRRPASGRELVKADGMRPQPGFEAAAASALRAIEPARSFRLAPSVKTLRTLSGRDA